MHHQFARWLLSPNERALVKRIENSGFFDRDFYIAYNADVDVRGYDPALHFLRFGAREGRSPSARFDVSAYLSDNPMVSASSLNPIVDWLTFGKAGLRTPPKPAADPLGIGALSGVPAAQRAKIRALAKAAGLFDEEYYTAVAEVEGDALEHYMRWGHRENRNPCANFDTHFYSTQVGNCLPTSGYGSALAHFIFHGRAAGVETRPPNSITLTPAPDWQPSLRIAIHLHLFYPEMAELFAALLERVRFDFSLFVSVCSEADANFATRIFSRRLSARNVTIRRVPNRGRDIAPFLLAFPEIWDCHDVVLHLHSKKSPHTDFGDKWCDWLLAHLLGDPAISLAALKHIEERPDIAILFPDNYHAIKQFAGWADNEARICELLDKLGAPVANLPRYCHFAAGSMAWFRVSAFNRAARTLTIDDFEEEEGQVEGTLAHALERALPSYAVARGQAVVTYYLERPPVIPPIAIQHARVVGAEPLGKRWMRDTPRIARQRPKALCPLAKLHNPQALEISWIIPDFLLGAGGHMTIFRIVELLERFGHRQTIWIQNARSHQNSSSALASIRRDYRKLGDRVAVRFLPDDVRQLSGDALIATDCWTAFPAAAATNFKERFYFIQDYEPYFYPVGENHLIAESTYKMGFSALCAGEWLLRKARQHGMWARRWDLASDPESYFPNQECAELRNGVTARILFYNRGYTPRRAVNLGLAGFEELARRRSDFEVLMFGQNPQGAAYTFPHSEMGILEPKQLGELYRKADLGVCFSATNYSLIPLEMMACNLPVVELDSESTRLVFPKGSISLAAPDPLSVADQIERLLDDKTLRDAQAAAARSFVGTLDWEVSARAIESAIRERLVELGSKPINPDILSAPAIGVRYKASIIIPTYNGGPVFQEVLRRAVSQTCDFEYDVLVLDSSSTDGTPEFVRQLGGRARVQIINKADFQHGRSRNLAISLTEGEIAAVLTQDATPVDDHWLTHLIAGFDMGPRIAGVIGRHRAYPAHNALTARDIERMFDRFTDLGPIFSLDSGLPSFLPRGGLDWRMILHFYSDNNSAMRRSVWRELPYPEVDWGEDQIWAWEALKLGFSKAYVDNAVVFHSHDSTRAQQIAVGVSEGRLFAKYFGYDLHPEGRDANYLEAMLHREALEASKLKLPQSDINSYIVTMRASIEGRNLGTDSAADP